MFCHTSRIFLVSVFLTSFNSLFVPTSQNPMSKLLRFLLSLKKRNGKKWSQIWRLLLVKGVKSPRERKKNSSNFCLTSRIFWYWCYYPHRSRDALTPVSRIFFFTIFTYSEAILSLNISIDCFQPNCMYQLKVCSGLYNF